MVAKNGMLRVVEAILAVLIVLTVLILISGQQRFSFEERITEQLTVALDEIAHDEIIRQQIILTGGDPVLIENLETRISERVEANLILAVEICALQDDCLSDQDSSGDVFVAERVVSSTLTQAAFTPRKIKVYAWRR